VRHKGDFKVAYNIPEIDKELIRAAFKAADEITDGLQFVAGKQSLSVTKEKRDAYRREIARMLVDLDIADRKKSK